MSKLEIGAKIKNTSRKFGKRFLTLRDMAEAKRIESISNSQFNRGQINVLHNWICDCGCGRETCIMVLNSNVGNSSVNANPKEY